MKRRKREPVLPIYLCAGLWIALGLICPGLLLKLWGLAAAAVLTLALYFLSSTALAPPRTHTRRRRTCTSKTPKQTA